MQKLKILFFIIIFFQLYGCGLPYFARSEQGLGSNKELNTSQDNFSGKAFFKFSTAISAYENSIITQSNVLEKQQRWRVAEKLFDHALKQLPNSAILKQAKIQSAQRWQASIDGLTVTILLNKADALIKNNVLYKEINKISAYDSHAYIDLSDNQDELNILVDTLQIYGQRAFDRYEYKLAKKCFLMANKIQPSVKLKNILLIVDNNIDLENIDIKSSKNYVVLFNRYEKAFENEDFLKAKNYMNALLLQDADDPQLLVLNEELHDRIDFKIKLESGLAEGLYSSGEIEEALITWKSVLPLDPDNEKLKSDIARAERVLENLRKLAEKQTVPGF